MDLSSLSVEEIYELALRDNLSAEQDAIIMYNKYINALPEGDRVRKALEDIRDEERNHCGELYQLLFETDEQEAIDFEEGQCEVIRESNNKVAVPYVDGPLSELDDNSFWNYDSVSNEYSVYISGRYQIRIKQDYDGFWHIYITDDNGEIIEDVIPCGFHTSQEARDHANYLWKFKSTREKWMKGLPHMSKKIAKTRKYAMTVNDLVFELEDDLRSDGPFEDYDDASQYLMEDLDGKLIYNHDIMDLAVDYVDATEVLNMFYEELLDDVLGQIDLDEFVEEDEEEY